MTRLLLIACAILLATGASAQEVTLDFGSDGLTARTLQLIALITVLSLAPGLAVMVTCFPFVITVLAILRQAIGLQQSPPNMLLVSLALFLTYYVMEPVFLAAWQDGLGPLSRGDITVEQAFAPTMAPFQTFMTARVDPSTLAEMTALRFPDTAAVPETSPLSVLIPSFMISEVARAFQIGFLLFLPFLIIDMVVAAILMSMGMMMVPPAIVSLPFKLAFFVIADGWTLVTGALVRSYF